MISLETLRRTLMISLETLQKYGLKTDVKSIKERMTISSSNYWKIVVPSEHASDEHPQFECDYDYWSAEVNNIYSADLALLCSLAEKGERYEKAVVSVRARLAKTYSIVCETEVQKAIASAVDAALEDVITEAEGE